MLVAGVKFEGSGPLVLCRDVFLHSIRPHIEITLRNKARM